MIKTKNLIKKNYKIIIKRPSGNMPTEFSKEKIKLFLEKNSNNLQKFVYLGWVKRTYPIEQDQLTKMSKKKDLRFVVSTDNDKKSARQKHKNGSNWNIDIWDIT